MNKEQKHLPVIGIGPLLCAPMVIISAIAILLSIKGSIPFMVENKSMIYIFVGIGILLILEGIICFFGADFGGGLVKSIKSNQLKTNGSYAYVRNPCYSLYFLGSSGALLIAHNLLLLVFPILFWIEMTIVLKNTEEKWLAELYGQEYIDYCKQVNRCIPWFPKKRRLKIMNNLTKYISSQFKNPKGFGGVLITIIQNIVNQELYKATSDIVSLAPGDWLLDIGYGNGHLLKKLYKKQQIEMYGIDISNDAKQMATKKNKKAATNGNLHLSIGNCCNLQYDANIFDAVTTINTVYFWSDTIKGLSEIHRVLKPGKSFYNVLFTKEYLDTIKYTQIGYKKFEPEELIETGKKAGFQNVSIREISKGKSFIVIYTK